MEMYYVQADLHLVPVALGRILKSPNQKLLLNAIPLQLCILVCPALPLSNSVSHHIGV